MRAVLAYMRMYCARMRVWIILMTMYGDAKAFARLPVEIPLWVDEPSWLGPGWLLGGVPRDLPLLDQQGRFKLHTCVGRPSTGWWPGRRVPFSQRVLEGRFTTPTAQPCCRTATTVGTVVRVPPLFCFVFTVCCPAQVRETLQGSSRGCPRPALDPSAPKELAGLF
jgi:hypothetical protein